MRFYLDGIELDVDDPLFHQDLDETELYIQQLSEYKNDNTPHLPMA